MQLEHSPVRRRRQVERDTSSHRVGDLLQLLVVGRSADQRLHADLDIACIPAGSVCSDRDRGLDRFVDEALGANRVETNAVGHLAGDAAHVWPDGGDVDRNVGVLDRPWVEQRNHEAEVVVLGFELQRFAELPGLPHRSDGIEPGQGCQATRVMSIWVAFVSESDRNATQNGEARELSEHL